MKSPRYPASILQILEFGSDDIETRSAEVNDALEKHPQYRDEVEAYVDLVSNLGNKSGFDEIPADLESSLSRATRSLVAPEE